MKKTMLKKAAGILMFSAALIAMSLYFVNCGDDGGEEAATLAGKYKFSKAVVSADIVYESITIPANTDVTAVMVSALLAEAPCDDPDNAAIDLRTNKQLWYICPPEDNEEQGGTWSESVDLTQMTLNITVDVNGVPTPASVDVLDIVKTASKFSGKLLNFPIPGPLLQAMYASTGETWPEDLTPPFVKPASLDVEFTVLP